MTANMRPATTDDLYQYSYLYDSEGNEFVLQELYAEGIWEARGAAGDKCIFTSEIQLYTVKIQEELC